jgi:deazaflavin-dependent oxidoreductase (nitroreductase family)
VKRLVRLGFATFVFWFVGVPLFERFAPRDVVRAYQRLTMPFFRAGIGIVPGFGLVETIGRRTGLRRVTPVGGRIDGDTFWFVAGAGRDAFYLRNIEAEPRVRVQTLGRWYTGTATILETDDAAKRMFWVNPFNGLFLLLAGGDRLTVRVDLD